VYSHNLDEAPLELWVLLLLLIICAGAPVLFGVIIIKSITYFRGVLNSDKGSVRSQPGKPSFIKVYTAGWLVCVPIYYAALKYVPIA